jgi:hypothetical protein
MNTYTHTDNPIDSEEYSLEVVGGLFSGIDLSKFKVHNPKTLFPPNFEMLQKNKCPICGRKLYIPRNKKIAYCKSKANDKFVIKGQTLLALGGSLK